MQQFTLKVTGEELSHILSALNAGVAYQQQQTAVLMAALQGQANAQVVPLNSGTTNPQAQVLQMSAQQGGQNVAPANLPTP